MVISSNNRKGTPLHVCVRKQKMYSQNLGLTESHFMKNVSDAGKSKLEIAEFVPVYSTGPPHGRKCEE